VCAVRERTYGHTTSGTPITDGLVERLADEAERGYDVGQLIAGRRRRARQAVVQGPTGDVDRG